MPALKRLMVVVLLSLVIVLLKLSPVSALTLEEAKAMAREQGTELKKRELEYETAQKYLEKTRSDLGIGIYGSEQMQKDIEELEAAVEEWELKIARKQEKAVDLQEEKEGLQENEPRLDELKGKLEEIKKEKEILGEELVDLRRGRANLLMRFRSTRAMEDYYADELDALETEVETAEDTLQMKPGLIDYMVEETYFSLLLLEKQEKLLSHILSYREQLQENYKHKLQLGYITPAEAGEAEEKVAADRKNLQNLNAQQRHVENSFKKILGLPLDSDFNLYQVNYPLPDLEEIMLMELPDLEISLRSIRAAENVKKAEQDLDDASPFERTEYSLAELRLEEAELMLEQTLKELETNYFKKKDKLKTAWSAYKNAGRSLKEAESKYNESKIRYEKGMLAGLLFREQGLELLEKEFAYIWARKNLYLQEQVYLFAREGIKAEVRIPAE